MTAPLRLAFLAVALAIASAVGTQAVAQTFTPGQQEAIRDIVRRYLLANPDVIVEALEILEERQKAQASLDQAAVLRQRLPELRDDPQTPSFGPEGADVAIVEFFDYRCTYCRQVVAPLAELLRSDGRVRIVYKELPILGPDSVVAARAALAAHRQGAYRAFHAALMARRGSFDDAAIAALATELGLDAARLRADMERPEIAAQIERNRALARELGIRGTPAFVIGTEIVPGAIDLATMRSLVAKARQR
ncbi:MAG: DsbA family protein [Rhodospirillales bacterium]|jgi:protein-disulfide isomerase